jgi:hypothetical protein
MRGDEKGLDIVTREYGYDSNTALIKMQYLRERC